MGEVVITMRGSCWDETPLVLFSHWYLAQKYRLPWVKLMAEIYGRAYTENGTTTVGKQCLDQETVASSQDV